MEILRRASDTCRRYGLRPRRVALWSSYLLVMTSLPFLMTGLVNHVRDPAREAGLQSAREAVQGAQLERMARKAPIRAESGLAYVLLVPEFSHLADSQADPQASPLLLCENDRPLGPPHMEHEVIRRLGAGRFSHWGPVVYFSTPDGSNPIKNGRRYWVTLEGRCEQ
jgi:hypothetical protein